MAVHTQVLPPTTGCEQPHPHLGGPSPALRVLREAELWPGDRPLRASVNAMGFGGINAHIVLESVVAERRETFSARERSLSRSSQDAELFLLAAETAEQLAPQVEKLFALAARLSRAELADLAAQLEKNLGRGPVRAAIVASKPEELAERLQTLKSWLQSGVTVANGFFRRRLSRIGRERAANCLFVSRPGFADASRRRRLAAAFRIRPRTLLARRTAGGR